MFAENIKKLAYGNTNFRTVLQTGAYSQIVAMSIPVGEDIGEETHPNTDQLLYIVDGDAEAIIDGELKKVEESSVVFVPAGVLHNLRNIGDEDLKIFTVYAPPEHKDGTVHPTKEDAKRDEH